MSKIFKFLLTNFHIRPCDGSMLADTDTRAFRTFTVRMSGCNIPDHYTWIITKLLQTLRQLKKNKEN